jgi:hypothetical protein
LKSFNGLNQRLVSPPLNQFMEMVGWLTRSSNVNSAAGLIFIRHMSPPGTHRTRRFQKRSAWFVSQSIPSGRQSGRHRLGRLAVLAVLPIYLHTYGPANFLWFCDAALLLTVAGMWLESSLLISMCAVGILLPQCLWLVDFGGNLLGFHLIGLTNYMFDRQLAAVHPRAFAFSWLAALAARLAPVPSGL